ncbi:kynureninase [Sporosarcina sp. ANT_H38]|uniref:kynureninase n=1 Tax=Sporosarcina sp. ANT_H38 TaxID=2597358 RepID=UPI0011F0CF07|nr:kynureninase [Sporosarcina sp. ANT_H38]KAA0966280.1 kynureninase [Sporosarcina sp. ANT_H38]
MEKGTSMLSREQAQQQDIKDEMHHYREEFYLQPGVTYLDGNSLGLMSKRAEIKVSELMESWKTYGIEGWTKGKYPWFFISEKLGEMCAPLVGASSEEVIVSGSTTSNIHQLVSTFYKPKGKRTKILADELTFPSDIYALQSQIKLRGYDPEEHLVRVKSRDGKLIMEEDIIAAMTDDIALIILPTVLYRSGQLLDIKRLTSEAHIRGICIGFDACHSIGAIPHYFSEWDVDFALWCNYKYLNGGPGSVGGLYVNKKHFGIHPGLAGWYSSKKDKQFDMEHTLVVEESAGAFQVGTPHVLSLAPIIGSLEMFAEVGIDKIRQKSLHITKYMTDLIEQELEGMGFSIGNPSEDNRRGGHICLEHDEAVRICKALVENRIIPDNRPPNIIRLAPVAFYTSYEEVWDTIQVIKKIITEKQYEKFDKKRNVVS